MALLWFLGLLHSSPLTAGVCPHVPQQLAAVSDLGWASGMSQSRLLWTLFPRSYFPGHPAWPPAPFLSAALAAVPTQVPCEDLDRLMPQLLLFGSYHIAFPHTVFGAFPHYPSRIALSA